MRAFCTRRASHCTPLARPARSRARLVRAACRARETVTAGRGLVIILVIGNMLCSEEHLHIPQVPIKTLQRRPGTARNSPSAPALLRGVAQGTPHRRQACAHTSARALGHAAPPPSMRAHREARARRPGSIADGAATPAAAGWLPRACAHLCGSKDASASCPTVLFRGRRKSQPNTGIAGEICLCLERRVLGAAVKLLVLETAC